MGIMVNSLLWVLLGLYHQPQKQSQKPLRKSGNTSGLYLGFRVL